MMAILVLNLLIACIIRIGGSSCISRLKWPMQTVWPSFDGLIVVLIVLVSPVL